MDVVFNRERGEVTDIVDQVFKKTQNKLLNNLQALSE